MESVLKVTFLLTIFTITVQCTPIRQDIKDDPSQNRSTVETKEEVDEKSRFLGFLNGLNTLGGLVGSRPIGGGNRNGTTPPRLQGRPGLGLIPDVTKGINTILTGVASGNLEQVLEGSFVFAPTGVQLVAGNVLDRVFMTTSSPAKGTAPPARTQATTSRTLTSQEAQKQLLQIIQEQQKKINALENMQNTEASIEASQAGT